MRYVSLALTKATFDGFVTFIRRADFRGPRAAGERGRPIRNARTVWAPLSLFLATHRYTTPKRNMCAMAGAALDPVPGPCPRLGPHGRAARSAREAFEHCESELGGRFDQLRRVRAAVSAAAELAVLVPPPDEGVAAREQHSRVALAACHLLHTDGDDTLGRLVPLPSSRGESRRRSRRERRRGGGVRSAQGAAAARRQLGGRGPAARRRWRHSDAHGGAPTWRSLLSEAMALGSQMWVYALPPSWPQRP